MMIYKLLILIVIPMLVFPQNNSVSLILDSQNINAVTYYNWTIFFNGTTNRSSITLNFPTQVKLTNTSKAYLGGTTQLTISSNTSNTLTLNTDNNPIIGTVIIMVINVINPPSAISTRSFSVFSNIDSSFAIGTASTIRYIEGKSFVCPWTFNLCTQQPKSNLTIQITTINPLIVGSNQFIVGHLKPWANNKDKSLLQGINSVTCEISFDGGTNYNTSVICVINNSRIVGTYTLTPQINSSSIIVVKIIGVRSPPTAQTMVSSSFLINTADGSGNIIDSYTSCVINSVCVTNLTNGIINPSALSIGSPCNTPQIYFNSFPEITVFGGDAIRIYYSPISELSGCSILKFWRLDTDITTMTNPSFTTYYAFTISQTMATNQNYNNSINLYLSCSSFKMPASETPNYLTFKFLRSGSQYLELNATVSAEAILFTSIQAGLVLSTYEMAQTSTYTFTFKSGKLLSATPMLWLDFPSVIGVNLSCTVSLSAGTINSVLPSLNSTENILLINLVAGASIPAGTTFTIIVTGVKNALSPIQYFIGLTTYYDSATTSRVQYNPNGFNVTFSAVNQPTVSLTPASLFVYITTDVFISLTIPIALPTNSQFQIIFPTGVTSVSAATTLLSANGNPVILSSGPTNTTNGLVFSSNAIPINSMLIITINLRTPSIMATYSYVKLVISNGVTYLQSLLTMSMNINQLSSMGLRIVPLNSIAGAPSSYVITLTLSIPHSDQFNVIVNLPTDAQLAITGSLCQNNCLSAITHQNNNSFSFVATNPNPNSTTTTDVSFNISTFSNPRSTGQGLPWNLTTQTIGTPSNMISSQSASPTISFPNKITAQLSLNQVYYRNNSSPVKIILIFTNKLIVDDKILLSMDTTTYSNRNLTCSSLYGKCTIYSNSTSGTLAINIEPNLTSIINNTLALTLEGLVSGLNTPYLDTNIITVTSFTALSAMIDKGSMNYNISCRDNLTLPNLCRQCNTLTYACTSCYSGWFLNNSICVTSCGNASNFLSFSNSTTGTCQTCINNCSKCNSATSCITCLSTSYYFYPESTTCNLICYNNSGYFAYTQSGQPICKTCYGYPLCLLCTSTDMGACTYCSNSSVLNAGICSGNCSTTGFYPSAGSCLPCDGSCSSCDGNSNINCLSCAANYYSYAGACLRPCPNGTAVAPSATTCGCDVKCLTCKSSSYYLCTICANSSLFALDGGCVISCPNASYISQGTSCVYCSTGCVNCNSNTCLSCNTGWYLYNNLCFTDCKQVGLQYDKSGNSCVLCPNGCSTCNNAVCTSCLSSYTLSGSQCIETCLIYKTCSQTSAQVLPLPGVISLALWTIIVLVIHFISHKNYIPYSLMLFSSVVEFVLILAVLSTANSTTVYGRLLQANTSYLSTIKLLLGLAVGFNYITNIVFIVIFIKYMKPLLNNPRQIDVISNIVVLVVGTITNYRFAIIAYAHMFPKPNIYISNPSKLTPVHYLCLASLITDIFPIIACGLAVMNQQPKSNLSMLSIDLLIVIALNIAITIWFVSASKPEQYFEEKKKYYTEDKHNETIDSIPNEKNASKGNIVPNGSLNFDEDFSQSNNDNNQQNDHENYKKFIANEFKIDEAIEPNNILLVTPIKQEAKVVTIKRKGPQSVDYSMDADYEPNLKSKHSAKHSQKLNVVNNGSSDENSIDENLSVKGKSAPANFSKQAFQRYSKDSAINKEIQEVEEENDFPDIQVNEKTDGRESVFNSKIKRLRPKRVGADKPTTNNPKHKNSGKSPDQPIKMMKKDNRVGYLESDAFESNPEPEDIQAIIKQKVWQSTVRLPNKKTLSHQSNQETGYEEISPSFYNIQNQRMEISEYDEAQSQI